MPSLIGYIRDVTQSLLSIRYWKGFYKFRFLKWCILASVPKVFRGRAYVLLRKRVDENLSGIVIIHGIKYIIRNHDDYKIVSPSFEKDIVRIIKPHKEDVFIDIGAHIGKYALGLARYTGKVLAVEAHPDNFSILKRNVELNNLGNVIALNIGAWSSRAKLRLFIGRSHGHHSFVEDKHCGFIEVDVYPMDEVIRDHNIKRVDWIKIDVEGAESDRELWRSNRDKVIALLSKYGYKVEDVERGINWSYVFAY